MIQPESTPLPADYDFAVSNSVTQAEVRKLFLDNGWQDEVQGFPNLFSRRDAPFNERVFGVLATVGVRAADQMLVGIGVLRGYVIGEDLRCGHLENLMVDSRHRGQGIGKALVSARVKIADSSNIEQLTTELDTTNTLPHHYFALGFMYDEYGELVRRRPATDRARGFVTGGRLGQYHRTSQ